MEDRKKVGIFLGRFLDRINKINRSEELDERSEVQDPLTV